MRCPFGCSNSLTRNSLITNYCSLLFCPQIAQINTDCFDVLRSAFCVLRCPFGCSNLLTRNLLITNYCSLLTAHSSLLTLHSSLLTVSTSTLISTFFLLIVGDSLLIASSLRLSLHSFAPSVTCALTKIKGLSCCLSICCSPNFLKNEPPNKLMPNVIYFTVKGEKFSVLRLISGC